MPNIRRGMMGAAGADVGGSGAVQFNGSTYFKRTSDLTGNANSIYFTYSYWFRLDEASPPPSYIYACGASDGARVMVTFATGMVVELRNVADQRIVDASWSYDATDTDNWHHACGNYDTGSTSNSKNYLDDSDVTAGQGGGYNGTAIDWTQALHVIGATNDPLGNKKITMSIYEFWWGFNINLPIGTTANRRKFINSDLTPVDLGSDGSEPTGTAPLIYMTGTPDEFATNEGSGGDFTLVGDALIDVAPPTVADQP